MTRALPPVMPDIDELERLAKAATPGPWQSRNSLVYLGLGIAGGFDLRNCHLPHDNAAFIAAANPAAILALIAKLREVELETETWRRLHAETCINLATALRELDEARALLATAIEVIDGLVDQQAMPDDWYKESADHIRAFLSASREEKKP